MHALANYLPKEDASQDYTLISSNQNNGISSFSFKRKIDTCDKESDNVILVSKCINNNCIHIILSYHINEFYSISFM